MRWERRSQRPAPGVHWRAALDLLPDAFPHHRHWKAVDTHPAYWRLAPTVDHLAPQARGSDGGDDNPVTTSMARNAVKGALDLADWG